MPPKKNKATGSTLQGNGKKARRDDHDSRFVSSDAQLRWSKFPKLGFIIGKHVRWVDFGHWNFKALFKKGGLMDFIRICEITYSGLVRMFYYNLTISSAKKKISSLMNGTKIELTVHSICDIFKLPNTEEKHYFWPNGDYSNIIPKETIILTICDQMYQGEKLCHQKYLYECARVINRIACHDVVPRAGHFKTMQPLQHLITYAIMAGWPLNFGSINYNVMMISQERDGSLPYGMALTRIFQHFEVDLDGASKEKIQHPLNDGTLKRMVEITRTEHGQKRANEVTERDKNKTDEDIEALGQSLDKNVSLMDLHESVDSINKRIDKIKQHFNERFEKIYASIIYLKELLEKQFPSSSTHRSKSL